jgi:hypothetical protein
MSSATLGRTLKPMSTFMKLCAGAVQGLSKGSQQYKNTIIAALKKLGVEAATPGTTLNGMLTSR